MQLSVIIPAYNEEQYIGDCLKAIFKQTEPADEVIVVDNNSTDKTAEIARELGARVVTEKQQGISFARNRGFDEAKYEIIARTDADTHVPKNWVQQIKTNFQTRPIDALGGTVYYREFPLKLTFLSNLYLKILKGLQKGRETLVGMNMALSKEIWNKVRLTVENDNKKVHEDIDLALKIWSVGGVVGYDFKLVAASSARRILKNPYSFFIEYRVRLFKTLKHSNSKRQS